MTRDLDHARALLAAGRRDHAALVAMVENLAFADEIFGFHAQQAVEKGLKAWLAAAGVQYPLIHDLTRLGQLAQESGLEPAPDVDLADLNRFAVQLRYAAFEDDEPGLQRASLASAVGAMLARIELGVSQRSDGDAGTTK